MVPSPLGFVVYDRLNREESVKLVGTPVMCILILRQTRLIFVNEDEAV